MAPKGWGSGGEETQGWPWDVTPAGPLSPRSPAHGPFPPQQEALPDETEVIEDPTTEVGGPAPPQHPPIVAPTALGRATGSDTSHCGALGSPRGGTQQCFLGFFLQISVVLWKKLSHQLFQSIPRARGSSSTLGLPGLSSAHPGAHALSSFAGACGGKPRPGGGGGVRGTHRGCRGDRRRE